MRRLFWVVMIVAVMNFVAHEIHCAALGGTALGGGVGENGVHYVVARTLRVGVSPEAWFWNRVHGISVFVTHGLASLALAGWFLARRRSPAAKLPGGGPAV